MILPALSGSTLQVWGEPTLVQIAKCSTPFEHDGSVNGRISRHAGGSAYATAIGVADLGVSVVFHGPFGEDEAGRFLLETARARGVEIRALRSARSRQSVVVVDADGSRSMISDLGDGFSEPYAAALEPLDGALLHVSLSSVVRDPTGATAELCVRSSAFTPLSIDAGSTGVLRGWSAERLARFLARTRPAVVFANEAEADALCSILDPGQLSVVGMLVVKHGADPTEVRTGEELLHVPVEPVDAVVDTTGAGDAFAAGFLSAWLAGRSQVVDAVCEGHRLAARTIAEIGTVAPR